MRISVLHGPNLNRLGHREPEVYGSTTLEEIDQLIRGEAEELGVEVETFQSNLEGAFLDHVAAAAGRVDGFVVNAAAWTHTSVAVRDALVATGKPFVEVHLSNVSAREEFRRVSYLSDVAAGVVYGFGPQSYLLGLRGLRAHLTTN